MDALKSLVQPLVGGTASSSVIDGMKLVVLGGTVETARRVSSSAWNHFVNSFFLTAHFSEEDLPYDWLMLWLSRRPEWQRSREFETTTRSANPGSTVYSPEDADWDAWEAALGRESSSAYGYDDNSWNVGDDDEMRPKTRVVFQPTYDTTHTIFYRGHWLRVKRLRRQESGCETISISVVARNNAILKQLVLQAKKEYEAESVHRIQIYFADAHGSWRWTDSRHKRPMGSIVLNPGVKEMLLEDARDFLKSEKWYADRGIPFRRGYLLHGVPGSGKSSLIHALAGQLQLDIYVVSLSASWISDNTLTNLMGRVPARCVLLLEDLDAAFVRSTNREGEEDDSLLGALGGLDGDMKNSLGSSGGRNGGGFNNGGSGGKSRRRFGRSDGLSDMNTLSLSGLLNALDGVAASEGRLLFATTNHLERLDPALSRPGRMDVWVEFKNASRWQAEALFRNFFPAYDEEDVPSAAEMDALHLDSNMHVRTFVPNEDEIRLGDRSRTPSTASVPASPAKSGTSLWNIASSATSLLSSTPSSSTLNSLRSTPPASDTNINAPPSFGASNTAYPAPPPSPSLKAHSVKPFLDKKTLSVLAKQFADAIPEEEFSVASLQGYLLKHKAQPYVAAEGAANWVLSELSMRERLKKEKAEREVKLRQVRERKRKVREEKERAKKEKERKEKEKERVKKLIAEKEEEEELEKMKTQLKEKEEAARKKKEEEEKAAKEAEKDKKKDKKKGKKGKGKKKEADTEAKEGADIVVVPPAEGSATDAKASEADVKPSDASTSTSSAATKAAEATDASVSSSVVVVKNEDEDDSDSESGSDGSSSSGSGSESGEGSWDEDGDDEDDDNEDESA